MRPGWPRAEAVTFPAHLLIPLASSFGYVAGVLCLKRSVAWGVGVWRTAFVANVAMAVCVAPLWLLGGTNVEGVVGPPWWQPAVAALLFFVGQIATFVAIDRGDISVATPVLGLKIVLVAFFSLVLLPGSVPAKWWVAAVLSTAAIGLLNRQPGRKFHHLGVTVGAAAIAAVAYAACDVLVQKWTPAWGVGRFLPWLFTGVAAYSLAIMPFFRAPLWSVPRAAWPWLVTGAVLLAVQVVGVGYTLGRYGDATAVNIVYSSRGLWSIAAVWWLGHWFDNQERDAGVAVLRVRLWGAVLMLAAIVLVVV